MSTVPLMRGNKNNSNGCTSMQSCLKGPKTKAGFSKHASAWSDQGGSFTKVVCMASFDLHRKCTEMMSFHPLGNIDMTTDSILKIQTKMPHPNIWIIEKKEALLLNSWKKYALENFGNGRINSFTYSCDINTNRSILIIFAHIYICMHSYNLKNFTKGDVWMYKNNM